MLAFKRLIPPVERDRAACAIFGALATNGSKVPLSTVIRGICTAENERGGTFGNGVAFVSDISRADRGKNLVLLVQDSSKIPEVQADLAAAGVFLENGGFRQVGTGNTREAKSTAEYLPLTAAVAAINAKYGDAARIVSFGHGIRVFKGLPSLSDLAATYELSGLDAVAAIAHTRFPTGSKAREAGAHPHCFGNVAIVHNGDVTSYHANLAATTATLAELVYRQFGDAAAKKFLVDQKASWVGTDSEAIAAMIYSMLKHGSHFEPGLSIPDIMDIVSPPFDNPISSLRRGGRERSRLEDLLTRYCGYQLDGPVSCAAIITVEDDAHLVAFRDRNTFRPLQVVVDRRTGLVYVASELRQIVRATGIDVFDCDVESYHLDPGQFLWASAKSGIGDRFSGRTNRPLIPGPPIPSDILHLDGSPNTFVGETFDIHGRTSGVLGNFGGSFANGSGTWEHFGSVQDNSFEGCSLHTVVIHGNCSQMNGNAFQGRRLFVRGAVDGRFAQQLRRGPYGDPVAIVGETAGMNIGRMVSSGRLFVLGLSWVGKESMMPQLVGPFAMTGAVGGTAYLRGNVYAESIGSPPERRAVIALAESLKIEGIINDAELYSLRSGETAIDYDSITRVLAAKPEALSRFDSLFTGHSQLQVERRCLTDSEKVEIRSEFEAYAGFFNLPQSTVDALLDSMYTIVKAGVK
ncbi:hypothetical protein HY990_00640 [Candidatus Micrarchaeota archaeon]|nr:hypothetical protein [Candidatus Micrarchaeota archaeon]